MQTLLTSEIAIFEINRSLHILLDKVVSEIKNGRKLSKQITDRL